MRIVSNFRDYYDGMMSYDKSYHNKVYVRKTERVKVPASTLTLLTKRSIWPRGIISYNTVEQIFIIAGKVVPFITLLPRIADERKETLHYFSKAEVLAGEVLNKVAVKYWHLDELFADYPDFTELHLLVKSPIIRIHDLRPDDKNMIEVEINPPLLESGLSKKYDAYQMYQMIDHFISNVMIDDKMTQLPLTDVEKLESKGFDKVVSFRKEKKKK